MNKKKTAFVYIYGFGCNTILQRKLLSKNIFLDLEKIINDITSQNSKTFKIGAKTYSMNELRKLHTTVSTLNKKHITYDLFFLLKNKHLIHVLNDIYLLHFTYFNKYKNNIDTIHTLCDSTTTNQIKNIGTYFCNLDRYSNKQSMKIEDNTYFKDSLNTVLKYIKDSDYNNVIVIGHSYGGSMVSKIAKYINNSYNIKNKDEISKLQMATIGSVYIPPYFKTSNIKLHHYVYRNDPAFTKCSRIQDNSNYPNLHIMNSTRESFKEDESLYKLFNKKNLDAHMNNYNIIIENILRLKNTKINIDKLI